jgi:hypothetical protein
MPLARSPAFRWARYGDLPKCEVNPQRSSDQLDDPQQFMLFRVLNYPYTARVDREVVRHWVNFYPDFR